MWVRLPHQRQVLPWAKTHLSQPQCTPPFYCKLDGGRDFDSPTQGASDYFISRQTSFTKKLSYCQVSTQDNPSYSSQKYQQLIFVVWVGHCNRIARKCNIVPVYKFGGRDAVYGMLYLSPFFYPLASMVLPLQLVLEVIWILFLLESESELKFPKFCSQNHNRALGQ